MGSGAFMSSAADMLIGNPPYRLTSELQTMPLTTDRAGLFLHYWRLLAPDLPEPCREWQFHPTRRWRFDWAFTRPFRKVAVEVDGGQYLVREGKRGTSIGGRHNTDADREKCNQAAALGWRVLRFSVKQLEDDPQHCVDLVREALAAK
jgi:hypothetical protein